VPNVFCCVGNTMWSASRWVECVLAQQGPGMFSEACLARLVSSFGFFPYKPMKVCHQCNVNLLKSSIGLSICSWERAPVSRPQPASCG